MVNGGMGWVQGDIEIQKSMRMLHALCRIIVPWLGEGLVRGS